MQPNFVNGAAWLGESDFSDQNGGSLTIGGGCHGSAIWRHTVVGVMAPYCRPVTLLAGKDGADAAKEIADNVVGSDTRPYTGPITRTICLLGQPLMSGIMTFDPWSTYASAS
ncbi:hypothetical protein ANFP_23000 [Acidithiobacillus ferrooxidans]|nr:hypothetical protein ANFP_23000 [Acidithiobacillus ferrooxidans]